MADRDGGEVGGRKEATGSIQFNGVEEECCSLEEENRDEAMLKTQVMDDDMLLSNVLRVFE